MKRKLRIAGAVLFAAVFLFSGFMLYREYAESRQSADAFAALAALVEEDPISPTRPVGTENPPNGSTMGDPNSSTDETEPTVPVITAAEKYAAVSELNSDFVGWLRIDGTDINYPVMQTPDRPDYYLRRNFEKTYSRYGVPYVQENCTLDVSDNVIIYGHNMNDGSMFAELCNYKNEEFYREHPTIHFDTLSGFGEYEIVTVFQTVAYSQSGFEYHRFVNAEDEAAFNEFLAGCNALRLYDTGVTAEYGDKLITLSTCEYSRTNGRMVIVAKKIDPTAP